MPSFVINTNIARDKVTENFIKELTALFAKLTVKPEQYTCVQVNSDQNIAFGGTSAPCALCAVYNIGRLDNAEVTKHLMNKIHADLGIPPDRMFIVFNNLEGGNVGFNHKTF